MVILSSRYATNLINKHAKMSFTRSEAIKKMTFNPRFPCSTSLTLNMGSRGERVVSYDRIKVT